ncbi:MAG: PucR family transcriptional regulator [Marmoricola sp.]
MLMTAEGTRIVDTAMDVWVSGFVHDSGDPARARQFVDAIDAEIMQAIPEIAADPVLVADLHQSTRAQWMAWLNNLRRSEHGLDLPPQAVDLARSLARRGKEVGVLLKVYLTAHHGVFAFLGDVVDQLGEDDPPRDQVLKLLWGRADRWMDESLESLIKTFFEERERVREGTRARRAELIEKLLSGEEVDATAAGAVLGRPLRQWHVAFIVWSPGVDASTSDALHVCADQVARCLPGGALLTSLVGSRDLWCWVTMPSEPDADFRQRIAEAIGEGPQVALGLPAAGAAGFRTSHLEARSAQELAMAAPHAPMLVDYYATEMLCLALERPDALRRMVQREVGALCGSDKNLAAIRETVLTYVTCRMNVEAAAKQLFVHSNTVRYRLARAEELLGHPLADRARHVELALQYVALFGA